MLNLKSRFLIVFSIWAYILVGQNNEGKLNMEDNITIKDHGFTEKGCFYTLEHAKKSDYKTRYRVWDSDFQLLTTVTKEDKIEGFEFLYASDGGKSFIYKDNSQLAIGSNGQIQFEEDELKELEIYHQFLTDKKFVGIGQKIEGKKAKFSWNSMVESQKVLSDDFFIFIKDIDTGEFREVVLKAPNECFLNGVGTKILYFDDNVFIMSFLKDTNEKERTYVAVTYDYNGTTKSDITLNLAVNDAENEKFAVVNLENGGFDQYISQNRTGFGNSVGTSSDVDHHTFANVNSQGNIKYDRFDKTFYTYSGIKPNTGDSGILIQKFDAKGELLWRKNHVFDDTSFQYINSFNRYLSFDIYPWFVGVSVNSTKGKSYCDFYILEKSTGEIIDSKKFQDYGFFKRSKKYNGLDVEYKVKTKNLENLGLDRGIIYASILDQNFKDYLHDLNRKGRYLISGHFTLDNLNLVVSPEAGNKILFESFSLQKTSLSQHN